MIHRKIFIFIGPSLVYEYKMYPNLDTRIGIIILLHVKFYTNYERQVIISLLVMFCFIVNHALIDILASNCF